jgi:hypothetical protein
MNSAHTRVVDDLMSAGTAGTGPSATCGDTRLVVDFKKGLQVKIDDALTFGVIE